MRYIFVALISGLIGVAIGYAMWGSGGMSENASFRSEPIPTEVEQPESTEPTSEQEVTTEGEMVIEASAMSPEQQALLRSFGIDPEGVTITAEMIACAETALGKERLDTILGGAAPTFFESAKLVGCYQL